MVVFSKREESKKLKYKLFKYLITTWSGVKSLYPTFISCFRDLIYMTILQSLNQSTRVL
jgi:hypothetical protein